MWHPTVLVYPCSHLSSCALSVPEGEPVRYRVETLVLFILHPVVVLALLSVASVLACRRLHHGRLQRLQEFDTEQGAVDGLITSNVGDSTLAVRIRQIASKMFSVFPILTVSLYSRISKVFSPPRFYCQKWLFQLQVRDFLLNLPVMLNEIWS